MTPTCRMPSSCGVLFRHTVPTCCILPHLNLSQGVNTLPPLLPHMQLRMTPKRTIPYPHYTPKRTLYRSQSTLLLLPAAHPGQASLHPPAVQCRQRGLIWKGARKGAFGGCMRVAARHWLASAAFAAGNEPAQI